MIRQIVVALLLIYVWGVMFPRAILSWFPVSPGSWLVPVNTVLYRLTEPVLAPVRRLIPPVRLGGMGLDMAFMVVFFGLLVVVIPLVASL